MRRHLAFITLSAVAAVTALDEAQQRQVPLTRPIGYYNPGWSPDGRTLVFESTLSGNYAIYTINVDGTGLRRLTVDEANNEQPAWSPDGRRIVFSSDRAGSMDLYVMNVDGPGQTRLTSMGRGGYYGSSFSPDGRWIVFQGRPDNAETRERVYIVASDGTGLRMLSDSSYSAEGPRWSQDGASITFQKVPYPKRLWSDMVDGDLGIARTGEQTMTIRRDGSGLAPLAGALAEESKRRWTRDGTTAFFESSRDGTPGIYQMRRGDTREMRVADATIVTEVNPSPDGRLLAYTRADNGYGAVYVYDIATRKERMLTGGRGAGPVGYLRTATLTAGVDTIDTYQSPRNGGAIARGNGSYVVRAMGWVAGQQWGVTDTWFDSTSKETARQSVRTARASLATELETVRAVGDSASLLITRDRATGWVVSQGAPTPRLIDGAVTSERFAGTIVSMAIAKAAPEIGRLFVAPMGALYGANPLAMTIDSVRVVRRDTLYAGSTALPVLVLERANGGQTWVDVTTGAQLLARGSAGPERWWWHIRRGVRPPTRW